jgi:hypothetical protein
VEESLRVLLKENPERMSGAMLDDGAPRTPITGTPAIDYAALSCWSAPWAPRVEVDPGSLAMFDVFFANRKFLAPQRLLVAD